MVITQLNYRMKHSGGFFLTWLGKSQLCLTFIFLFQSLIPDLYDPQSCNRSVDNIAAPLFFSSPASTVSKYVFLRLGSLNRQHHKHSHISPLAFLLLSLILHFQCVNIVHIQFISEQKKALWALTDWIQCKFPPLSPSSSPPHSIYNPLRLFKPVLLVVYQN